MKRHFLLIMLAMIVTISSCKKDENNNNNNNNSQNYMRGTVNGTVRESDLSVMAQNQSSVLTIAGRWGGAGGGFNLVVQNFTNATGSFNLGPGNMHLASYSDGTNANDTYTANGVVGNGRIEITEYSATRVTGTFQFTGRNNAGAQKQVTNGEFSIAF